MKCDARDLGQNTTSNRSENENATWTTLWDNRGRMYKYLNVNGRNDDEAAGKRQGRDSSALVTLLLSLRVAGGEPSGTTNGNRMRPAKLDVTQRTNGDVQKRDSDELMMISAQPVPNTTTVANATTTTTTIVTPRKEIERDVWTTTTTTTAYPLASTERSHVVNFEPDEAEPIVKSARDPDAEDELLNTVDHVDNDDDDGGGSPRNSIGNNVRLKIVLTVSSRDIVLTSDEDGANRATTARHNQSVADFGVDDDTNFMGDRHYVVRISDP